MPTYIIRNLPDEWQKFRAKAAESGWPVRALLLQLAADFAAGKIRPSVPPPPPREGGARSDEE